MGSSLYSEITIGGLKLKNRIVMPAVNLNYCTPEGFVTDKLISFYTARSKGGTGLIVVGAAGIDPEYITETGVIQLSHDKYISGLKRLTDGVHTGEGKVFIQLWHPGAYGKSGEHNGKQAVAPSAVLSNFTRETPRELSIPEIERLIRLYAEAAKRAEDAGFDGTELIASAGYLISEFLSPKTNKRTDKYGSDTVDGRMTFLREVVNAVKGSTGLPLLVRLSGNEFIPGGNGLKECIYVAAELEKLGVDAVSITGGWHETSVPQLTMDVPNGAFVYLAKAVKTAVGIPVVACNRLDAHTAENVVDRRAADMAAIGRGNIADPMLGVKAAAGLYELIRPCVGCNQQCMDNIFKGRQLGCLANADVASELLYGHRTDAVLVIGAGPAGMEYARVSAQMGAKVTIWEKSARYGGALRIASVPPGRRDFLKLADYLYNSCVSAGVEFVFNNEATPDSIECALKSEFDHVVYAAGGIEGTPDFPVLGNAVTVRQVLSGESKPGRRVIIIGGGAAAVETALYLSSEGAADSEILRFLMINNAESPEMLRVIAGRGGREVVIVSRRDKLGTDIGASTRWSMLKAVQARGVEHIRVQSIIEINDKGVLVRVDGEERLLECDSAVLALGTKPNAPPLPGMTVIGDANEPSKADEAIRTAHEIAAATARL